MVSIGIGIGVGIERSRTLSPIHTLPKERIYHPNKSFAPFTQIMAGRKRETFFAAVADANSDRVGLLLFCCARISNLMAIAIARARAASASLNPTAMEPMDIPLD